MTEAGKRLRGASSPSESLEALARQLEREATGLWEDIERLSAEIEGAHKRRAEVVKRAQRFRQAAEKLAQDDRQWGAAEIEAIRSMEDAPESPLTIPKISPATAVSIAPDRERAKNIHQAQILERLASQPRAEAGSGVDPAQQTVPGWNSALPTKIEFGTALADTFLVHFKGGASKAYPMTTKLRYAPFAQRSHWGVEYSWPSGWLISWPGLDERIPLDGEPE